MMREFSYRVARYLVSGGSAAAVNFAALYALTECFHVWYLASSVVAVSLGFLTSFVLQKFWAFRSRDLDTIHVQFFLHVLLSLVNLALNTVALYVLVEYVHLWYMLAQILISAALVSLNYVVYRRWIFP